MSDIMWTDRYQAAGVSYPDAETVCVGMCEGMGVYPVFDARALDLQEEARRHPRGVAVPVTMNSEQETQCWLDVHRDAGDHYCDGWHFVTCPTCGGTGKR